MKTKEIILWRKKLQVLQEQLEKEELVVGKSIKVNLVVADGYYRGDIEELNDLVSEFITGSICGLEEIGYTLIGATPDGDSVVRVTGIISESLND